MDKVLLELDGEKYCLLSKQNTIVLYKAGENSGETSLIDNALSDFDAAFNMDKNIVITYFSKEQNIVLATLNNDNKIVKKILYHYNDKTIYIDNFRLIICNDDVHVFFMEHNLSNPKKILLKHYISNGTLKVNEIAVINNIQIKPFYSVAFDKFGMLHLVYVTTENTQKIYYTTFINNIWTLKTTVSEAVSIEYPNIKIDDKRNIHICWVEENIIKELKYRKKIDGGWPKGSWDKKITLSFSDTILEPCISIIDSSIWCTWIQQNTFYSAISSDGGNSFSRPFKLAEKPSSYELVKKIEPSSEKITYANQNGYELLFDTDKNDISYDKDSYFTFYIKEVQEYLSTLSKKIENLQKEKIHLERNLNQKSYEIALKNRSIEELKENLKKFYEDRTKYTTKIDNLNSVCNNILSENEKLKKQIKDLQNKIIILNSKLNEKAENGTIDKIKSIFFGKSNEHL
ncbi:hypothetical protein [Thermoanaerobacterium thermosaccharolyticum]|uniref:Uncharacterized protein n=1 Tax=Thermoanaerobacterium thermosaccharolyticum TaxID=1517 RepID=A0A231VIH3_THETR|nr:hypothetical protein [Thermoanaerobacterium thermosaccharolyticum]OXT07811.1 hypothetical protein CE561_06160 [Thermoanaerobacterium thermosaccharolyticum]